MPSGEPGAVELHGVRKSYGPVEVLRGVDLELQRGEVYAFLGRNGAGKSTTLRIVMGITRADAGVVKLFGEAVGPGDTRQRQRIGYVAQEQHFYDWMTPQSLGRFVSAFYPSWKDPAYERLLRVFDLPPRKIRTFSGGMKVKLALALALAHDPEVLVFDEPTAGLDPIARREFIEIVRELTLSGRHTLLFSSHLIDEVERVSHRVGILEQGLLRYQGSLEDLAARARLARMAAPAAHELAELQQLLARERVKILSQQQGGETLELILWSDEPRGIAALTPQLPSAQFMALSLEDIFVALVRSGQSLVARAGEAAPEAHGTEPAGPAP
jgi:ABC-2 type transport system ATP-binding protein